MAGIVGTLVGLLVAGLGGLVPAAATYYLVPWQWIDDQGTEETSEQTLRATKLGVSAMAGGTGLLVVSAPLLLFGLVPLALGVVIILVSIAATTLGVLVPIVFVLRDAL